jgi:hypothetical protein
MYAARPHIMQHTDRPLGKKFSQYFSQTLLPDYIEETGVDWNVVFDARGHFYEPHTNKEVPLGTIEVGDYLPRVRGFEIPETNFDIVESHYPTFGPENRFSAVFFTEKEGFMPLFRKVKLFERYDMAPMSTKGMSVTASRELVDQICGEYDIPLLILHDFDKYGFSIAGTLTRDSRRYRFENAIDARDLGLRMEDIEGLESEEVYFKSRWAASENMRENGATEEEIEFMLDRRVELNAFPSDKLIAWIEGKLEEHGIKKVVPDEETLADAYLRVRRQVRIQTKINEILENEVEEPSVDVPDDLLARVTDALDGFPATSWDEAVRDLVEGGEVAP